MQANTETSFVLALSGAAAAAIALPFVIGPITTVSTRSWPAPMLRSQMLSVGAVSAALGAAAAIVTRSAELALAGAMAGAALYYAVLLARYRVLRRVVSEFPRLRDPSSRDASWERVSELLDRKRPESHQSRVAMGIWNSAVQRVAGHLIDLGEFERAAQALEKLHGVEPGPAGTATVSAMHALVCMHSGKHAAASAALASIARPAPARLTESMIVSAEALVHAIEGRAAEALSLLDGWAYPATWHVRTRLEARAHALASKGDEAGARATLFELERKYGAAGLECVERAGGPASELARTIATASKPDPYR